MEKMAVTLKEIARTLGSITKELKAIRRAMAAGTDPENRPEYNEEGSETD